MQESHAAITTPDPTIPSLGFLALAQCIKAQVKVMRIDAEVADRPTRDGLEALVTVNEARPDSDGAKSYFAGLLSQTIAQMDAPVADTRKDDLGHLAEAAFHDDADTDALFARMAKRHGVDEALLRSEVDEMNDATRRLIEAERG